MNVVRKFTKQNMARNPRRTIVTIIGVMLSAALICTVVGMVATFRKSIIEDIKSSSGDFHAEFGVQNEDQYDLIMQNAHVEKAGTVQFLGEAVLPETISGREYQYVYGLNETAFTQMNVELIEGRYPENSSEILIPEDYSMTSHAPKVGDTITLNVGDRMMITDEGEEIAYSGWTYAENEIHVPGEDKTYTVVGIAGSDYRRWGYGGWGYDLFTREDEWQGKYTDVFVRFDQPKNFAEIFLSLNTTLGSFEDPYNYSTSTLVLYEGGFNHSNMKLVLWLGIIISLIIVGTSIFVISNSFRISVEDKKMQFGMLASVGATKKQIRGMVLREAMYIFVIGTAAGLALGALVIWILDQVVNLLLKDMLSIKMIYTFPLWVVLFTIALSAITIFAAALLPARAAAKISPIEIIRGGSDVKMEGKSLHARKIVKKIFGTGGVIAEKNMKRSRKKYRTSVISLTLGVAVFVGVSTFVGYGKKLVGRVYTSYDCNIEVWYRGERTEPFFSKTVTKYEKVRTLAGVKDSFYAYSTLGYMDAKRYGTDETDEGVEEFNPDIFYLPEKDFDRLLSELEVTAEDPSKVAILVDNSVYSDDEDPTKKIYRRTTSIKPGDIIDYSYISEIRQTVDEKTEEGTDPETQGRNDGTGDQEDYDQESYDQEAYENEYYDPNVKTTTSIHVAEVITGNEKLPVGLGSIMSNDGMFAILVSEKSLQKLPADTTLGSLYMDVEEPYEIEQTINEWKNSGEETELGVFNYDAEKTSNDRMILVLEIFLYGFITVIVLIAVTNVFNTFTTAMNLRSREFAMLRSIGMTKKEFTWMIRVEGILVSLKALIFGIPIGIALSYAIHIAVKTRYDFGYSLPWKAILIAAVAVVLTVGLILVASARRLRKKNIIETIRRQNY